MAWPITRIPAFQGVGDPFVTFTAAAASPAVDVPKTRSDSAHFDTIQLRGGGESTSAEVRRCLCFPMDSGVPALSHTLVSSGKQLVQATDLTNVRSTAQVNIMWWSCIHLGSKVTCTLAPRHAGSALCDRAGA